jgi:short subunit dehydrogenase-like uncharacterized protein
MLHRSDPHSRIQGFLVAQYLLNKSKDTSNTEAFTFAIAGRSLPKLEEVRRRLGAEDLPIISADSADPESLRAMFVDSNIGFVSPLTILRATNRTAQCYAVATTVGPYLRYGSGLVAACVDTRTNYADLTGEAPFIQEMVTTHHERAQRAGVKIVNCCGFDCIPCDLGVLLATRTLSQRGHTVEAVKLLTTTANGGASGGTLDSIGEVVSWARKQPGGVAQLNDPYFCCPELAADSPLRVDSANTSKKGLSWDSDWGTVTVPWAMAVIDNHLVRRSAVLRGEAHSYDEAMSVGAVGRVARFVGSHWGSFVDGLKPKRPRAGEGPSEQVQRDGGYAMTVLARGGGGRCEVEVLGKGDPGYAATSKLLAESALCLAFSARAAGTGAGARDGDGRGVVGAALVPDAAGVLTPSTAMGMALVERLNATGQFSFKVAGGGPLSTAHSRL